MAPGQIRKHLKRYWADALEGLGLRKPRPRVRNLGAVTIITEGLESNLWTDFYHNAMTVTWPAYENEVHDVSISRPALST